MSDKRQSEQKHLQPSDGRKSLEARSGLASRGLELALDVQRGNKDATLMLPPVLSPRALDVQRGNEDATVRAQPRQGLAEDEIILLARTIEFPTDDSTDCPGRLWCRRWDRPIITWDDIEEAEEREIDKAYGGFEAYRGRFDGYHSSDSDWLCLGDARGEFGIPSGWELSLYVSDGEDDLALLRTLAPGDIQRIGLGLVDPDVGFDDIACLQDPTGLLMLQLFCLYSDMPIHDKGLRFLQNMNGLRGLHLIESTACVTDEVLKYLQNMSSLQSLEIRLQSLEIGDEWITSGITNEGLKFLQNMNNLRRLRISIPSGGNITGEGLKYLQNMHSLRSLTLDGITGGGLKFLTNLRSLRSLCFSDLDIVDEGLKYLQNMDSLRSLHIAGNGITDTGLKFLKNVRSLRRLSLFSCGITDEGLRYLQEFHDLEALHLSLSSLSVSDIDAECAKLKNALPSCQIFCVEHGDLGDEQ